MSEKWLTVVGIGADGLAGLSAAARARVAAAEILVGGERQLALAPGGTAERIVWGKDFVASVKDLARHRGRRVVVLASGDPMSFGAGSAIARQFDAAEFEVLPVPGAFSLAAARLAWPLPEVACITAHGRPIEVVNRYLAPGARLMILSGNRDTPAKVAQLLRAAGCGQSRVAVLEYLGAADESRTDGIAESWNHPPGRDLNVVAVECIAGPDANVWPRTPGLPEEAFEHDGQITKRDVRASTLARLAPMPGQVLWDVGAGSGAVAIEWLRAEPSAKAVAIERDPERLARIERNARRLGVPELKIVAGAAPDALKGLSPAPDAVFVGGGVSIPGLLETAWDALKPGGRLVANAVTTEGQAAVARFNECHPGELTRLSVARSKSVAPGRTTMKPLMDVLQLAAVKA